jgi:small subunit ribosomal protein S1
MKTKVSNPLIDSHGNIIFTSCDFSKKDKPTEALEVHKKYEIFEKLLEKYVLSYDVGDRASGTVVSIDNRSVLVDMGLKDYAILPLNEISIKGGHAEDFLKEGDTREFLVIRSSSREVQLTVSLKAIEMEMAWERARERLNSGSIIDAPVLEATKGGFRVCMEGQTSFLPVSQISPKYLNEEIIGKVIPVKLVDVDESKNRCVCSNRKAISEDENVTSTLSEIKVGDIVQGYVQNLTAFGAFIDLNGLVGLLHVSQISNDRICSVEGIFLIGEPIKCMVLAVDKDKGRLSLTTKKLEPSPGDMLRNRELVMERAEDMAQLFCERVAAAEAALRAVEEKKVTSSSTEHS